VRPQRRLDLGGFDAEAPNLHLIVEASEELYRPVIAAPHPVSRPVKSPASAAREHATLRPRRVCHRFRRAWRSELYSAANGLRGGTSTSPADSGVSFVQTPWRAAWRATLPDGRPGCGAAMTGRIEFLGRFDDQVKIRGFRVEPPRSRRRCGRTPRWPTRWCSRARTRPAPSGSRPTSCPQTVTCPSPICATSWARGCPATWCLPC